MTKQTEVILLWTLIVLGFIAHSQTEMLPAFWGQSIVAIPAGSAPAGMIAFMAAITYLLPVVAILLLTYGKGKGVRVANAVLASLYGVFCILHMGEWAEGFNPVQLTVMPLMAVVGVILAVQSVRYAKSDGA